MRGLLLIMMFACAWWQSAAQTAPAKPLSVSAAAKKIDGLLKRTSYQWQQLDSVTWTIPFKGNNKETLTVIITESAGLTIVFCVIDTELGKMLNAAQLLQLMKSNLDFDRVKLGIDDEGGLMVRSDISTRIMDFEELETNIEQVAAAADEVHGTLKPVKK